MPDPFLNKVQYHWVSCVLLLLEWKPDPADSGHKESQPMCSSGTIAPDEVSRISSQSFHLPQQSTVLLQEHSQGKTYLVLLATAMK